MSSRRVLKAAQAIREVVSMAILTDLKDPRINNVTVTFVEVSADLRLVHEEERKQHLCLSGLRNATGYLQSKVGKRIDTKYTPRLQFVLDEGVKNSMLVAKILDEVLPPKEDPVTVSETATENPELSDQSTTEETSEAEPGLAEENGDAPMEN